MKLIYTEEFSVKIPPFRVLYEFKSDIIICISLSIERKFTKPEIEIIFVR